MIMKNSNLHPIFETIMKPYTASPDCANKQKSLPTDACIEDWWSEGRGQDAGFWDEAPYRTNGDVVAEIKIALKYFIETWQK